MKSSKKVRVWERDFYVCRYCCKECSLEEVSVDHIIPRISGGTDNMDNLATACKKCNQAKGRREEFKIYHRAGVDNKIFK